ncbi:MAG: 16S rRNA pseudouridine(516) synthase [Oscillospiraceae bacterium]|nr:16S rRNA pseudouridine(516) synthase [Oscillospiraceae bacterium]
MKNIRLDKLLSEMGICSRKEAGRIARNGSITVNGDIYKDSSEIIDISSEIRVMGERIEYDPCPLFMMNKPAGLICAADDPRERTVFELLGERERRMELFTVGRLDKDTTGLLILTNDGALAHKLLSPKKHVDKIYDVTSDLEFSENDVAAFKEGVFIDRETKTLPALLQIDSIDPHKALLTIREGKFHQIKRMLNAVDKNVTALKRVCFAGIPLDPSLPEGAFRHLTKEEADMLINR